MEALNIKGYRRSDGRIGIRNTLLVVYTVECAHHVARQIANEYADKDVQLIGFGGCAPNSYANRMLKALCVHPNVAGGLFVSLGCENMDRPAIITQIKSTGRLVDTLTIQEEGGTLSSIEKGKGKVQQLLKQTQMEPDASIFSNDLSVGTICGGSDALSGLSVNPAIGKAFDHIISSNGTGIFEESGELIGCEDLMVQRAKNDEVGQQIAEALMKAKDYYKKMGHESFSAGNVSGGLTTIEEKSLGAYCKSGDSAISGVIKPGVVPERNGLYFLDIIPDGEAKWGFPNINDNAEIVELISCGCQLILFSTGRGSVVGSAISPVIKICSNPKTYQKMPGDMDINAGKIISSDATIDEVGKEITEKIKQVASGGQTVSEQLGHQEFALTYKHFDTAGGGCRL